MRARRFLTLLIILVDAFHDLRRRSNVLYTHEDDVFAEFLIEELLLHLNVLQHATDRG